MSANPYSKLHFVYIALVMILATACDGSTNSAEEPSEGIESTSAPPLAIHQTTPVAPTVGFGADNEDSEQAREAKTGIEEVDDVIDVILAHDFEARLALVRLTTAGCTKELGLGGPPKCTDAQPEGSLVDYLPVLGPGEGMTVLPENLGESMDFRVESLYLAYRQRESLLSDNYYSPGVYVLVFVTAELEGVPFISVHINGEGRIVRLDYMAWDPLSVMEREAAEILVPPPERNLSGVDTAIGTSTPLPNLSAGAGQILSFNVLSEVERPGPGDTITFQWETTGGSAEICVSYGGWTNYDCLEVDPSGQMIYTLRTQDPVADHWADVTLSVRDEITTVEEKRRLPLKCHYSWFQDGLTKWCPFGPIDETAAVGQIFERGQISVSGNLITIMFDEPGDLCRTYNLFIETEQDVDLGDPPPGLFPPGESSSMLWSGVVPGTEDLRARLGWAVSPEETYTMKHQCERRPDAVGNCFFTAVDGGIFLPTVPGVAPDDAGIAAAYGTCRRLAETEPGPVDEPANPSGAPCDSPFYMDWASRELEEISDQLQSALDAASIEGSSARAFAYGEDWVEYDENTGTSSVCNFSVMQTDYEVTIPVEDLADLEYLGAQLSTVIEILGDYPPGSTPGSQPGMIWIRFSTGESIFVMRFSTGAAAQAYAAGLAGAELIEALRQ
jgi:hypothetical protein